MYKYIILWKKQGCPPIVIPSMSADEAMNRARAIIASERFERADLLSVFDLGWRELSGGCRDILSAQQVFEWFRAWRPMMWNGHSPKSMADDIPLVSEVPETPRLEWSSSKSEAPKEVRVVRVEEDES